MKVLRAVAVATAVVLTSADASAQHASRAELVGTVTSRTGGLGGVRVMVDSASLQGERATLTAPNGSYYFSLLPPGTYRVHFVREGLTPVSHEARLSPARTTRLNAFMVTESFGESMTVTASSRPESNEIATSVDGKLMDSLPAGRSLRDLTLFSPAANAQGLRGRLVISGAPSWDSLFLVDGVVVNENLTGQPHNLFIEDSLDEVSILSGAISAEFGRFTGGVVSVVTRRGGNEFSGSLRDTLTSPRWTGRTPYREETPPSDRIDHVLEGTLGGYGVTDRLWFFLAGRASDRSERRFTAITGVPYDAGMVEQRWEGKITARLTPSHTFVGSYLDLNTRETNVVDTDAGRISDLAALTPLRTHPTSLFAASYDGALGRALFLEAHYSNKRYSMYGDGGRSTDRIEGTFINARGVRTILNAPVRCGVCGSDARNSASVIVKATHQWNGHLVTAGAERFAEEWIANGNRSASTFNIQTGPSHTIGDRIFPTFNLTTTIGWTPLFVKSNGTDLRTTSAFVNDRWEISPRVSVNLGVRYDRNDGRDADGNVVSDDEAWSPRLSMIVGLDRQSKTRLSLSFSRYTSKILDGMLTSAASQQAGVFGVIGWQYRGPEINGLNTPPAQLLSSSEALAQVFAWFDSVGGVHNRSLINFVSYPGYSAAFPETLDSPSADEITAGIATAIGAHGSARLDLISREWHDFYAARLDQGTGTRTDPLGFVNDLAWIVNDDETKRVYRGIQLQGTGKRGRFAAGGGYMFSKLRGNDEAEELTIGQPPRNLPLSLWYPELVGYAQRRPVGYLAQDQRHRARVWLGIDQPIGRGVVNVSLLHSYESGRPYSAVGEIGATGRTEESYQGAPPNPGYTLSQRTLTAYYFSSRGAFRTDDTSSTDIALNYEVPFRRTTAFLQIATLNVFNNAAVVSVNTEVITRGRHGAGSGLEGFNPFTTTPVEGVHYRLSPSFGQPIGPASFQTPRTFRVSAGFRFSGR